MRSPNKIDRDPGQRMRPALATFVPPSEERLQFMKQLGVEDIVLWGNTFAKTSDRGSLNAAEMTIKFEDLLHLKARIEDAGLRLIAIENVPNIFYEDVMLGGEAQEEQLDALQKTIRNIGRVGVPYFGYNWMPSGVWRTSFSHRLRGDAKGTAVNLTEIERAPSTYGREYDESDLWENYERFLRAVLPVAERVGVTLAPHPNDPPVESVGGVPGILRSFDAFKRAMDIVPSENHGITLCLGNWSAMGEDLVEVIRHFGDREQICYVHFQTVRRSSSGSYHETFIDEDHYYDPYEVLATLKEVNFRGVMIPGHVPQIKGDTEWRTRASAENTPYNHPMGGHRARGYTVGYLRGMIKALYRS